MIMGPQTTDITCQDEHIVLIENNGIYSSLFFYTYL